MNLPPFREESREFYLRQIFHNLQNKGEISLWQNLDGNRIFKKAILNKIITHTGFLKFLPMQGQHFCFNSRLPIYFYERGKVIIFKSRIIFHSGFGMEVVFPSMVMSQECRAQMRSEAMMEASDRPVITFQLINSTDSTPYEKPLIDFSDKGASFRITSEERNRFLNSKSIIISPPNDQHEKL